MDQVPVYPQAALGYRVWNVDSSGDLWVELSGMGVHAAWPEHRHYAVCLRPGTTHPAPAKGCRCGVHGYYEIERALRKARQSEQLIAGAIAARGMLRCTHYGFRAEEAQIIGLLRRDPHRNSIDEALAERYQVPLFDSWRELEEHARSLGLEAPAEDLRPRRPPFWRNDEILGDHHKASVYMFIAAVAVGGIGDTISQPYLFGIALWMVLMSLVIACVGRMIERASYAWLEPAEEDETQAGAVAAER